MKIQRVDPAYVHTVWPQVSEFIANALEYQNDYTLEQVKVYLAGGEWVLLVAVDGTEIHGAAVVQFFNRPNDRIAFVVAIGGRLVSNKDTFAQLQDVCRLMGATAIEGAARESIARLWTRYGFTEKYRIVGVKL